MPSLALATLLLLAELLRTFVVLAVVLLQRNLVVDGTPARPVCCVVGAGRCPSAESPRLRPSESLPNMADTNALKVDRLPSGIVRITFDQPNSRANTLNQAVQSEFEKIVGDLESDASATGLLLCSGKPGMFIAGADLKELAAALPSSGGARELTERFLRIIARIEKLPFPTLAAIDGGCMGGGLELSLGFDYRLAGGHPKTEIGLPETKIGLIPGWGGTQRLPRVVGVSQACEMITTGEPVKAPKARDIGLVFDAVPSDKLEAEAVRVLTWARETGDWKNVRQRKQQPFGLSEDQSAFAFAVAQHMVLAKTRGMLPAPLAALDAIEKGINLPLADGIRVETEHFLPLVGSTISRNLIAIFFMNQRLAKDPGVTSSAAPADVKSAGVVGAGLMGAGIAGAHIRRGVRTTMLDVTSEAVAKGLDAIVKVMQSRMDIGRMTQPEMLHALGALTRGTDRSLLKGCDVVIEAVVENEKVKAELFREFDAIVGESAILASNTSTISITRLSASVRRPERFAGFHFFNPVDRMQLVEVIRGEKTDDATVATLVVLAKKLGKSPIVVKDCPGFLVNRVLFPYLNEALVLVEEGVSLRAIDKAAEAFGMPMGPITLSDVVGLDTCLFAGQVVNAAYADRHVQSGVLQSLVSAGRLGKKSGAGFFCYAKSSRGADDPALAAILEKHRSSSPPPRSGAGTLSTEELQDRLFLPMLVEATRVLDEKIVRDPADVDMGLILGIGFPVHHGGILRWADNAGTANIVAKLDRYATLGPRYAPTPTLREMAKTGAKFFGG